MKINKLFKNKSAALYFGFNMWFPYVECIKDYIVSLTKYEDRPGFDIDSFYMADSFLVRSRTLREALWKERDNKILFNKKTENNWKIKQEKLIKNYWINEEEEFIQFFDILNKFADQTNKKITHYTPYKQRHKKIINKFKLQNYIEELLKLYDFVKNKITFYIFGTSYEDLIMDINAQYPPLKKDVLFY